MSDGGINGAMVHAQSKKAWQETNLLMESNNAAKNLSLLEEMRDAGRAKCISEFKGKGPALIIGSGSSLEGVLPTISQWKGAVFCSTSHGSTLVKYGCHPTAMIAVDPRTASSPEDQDEFGVPPGEWDQTAYMAHVSTPNEYFKRWFNDSKGTAYLFRILEPTQPWYTKHLPSMYPWVKVSVLPFIDSLASELQLAARLGYNPLYLIGADYGGARFNMWQFYKGAWKFFDLSWQLANEFVGPGGLGTSNQLLYAMRGILIGAFMQIMNPKRNCRIYQMSTPSNITQFPFRPWEKVLSSQGEDGGPWGSDKEHVAEKIEISLAASDTFLIPNEGGNGVDYRVYIATPQNYLRALHDLSYEIIMNKYAFAEKELQLKMPVREMIEKGLALLEKGDMLLYGSEEMKTWDWKRMKGFDIEAAYQHMMKMKMLGMQEEAKMKEATKKAKEEEAEGKVAPKDHEELIIRGPEE